MAFSQRDVRYLTDEQGATTDVLVPIETWKMLLQSVPRAVEQPAELELSSDHILAWFRVVLSFAQQQSGPDFLRPVLSQLLEDEGVMELMEEIALSEAIAVGAQTETVAEAEVLALLNA